MLYYKSTNSDEIVFEEDALDYVLDKLKIKIEDDNGTYDLEQQEFLNMIVEWYFSGNWILLKEEEE